MCTQKKSCLTCIAETLSPATSACARCENFEYWEPKVISDVEDMRMQRDAARELVDFYAKQASTRERMVRHLLNVLDHSRTLHRQADHQIKRSQDAFVQKLKRNLEKAGNNVDPLWNCNASEYRSPEYHTASAEKRAALSATRCAELHEAYWHLVINSKTDVIEN